jgi:hypothetical protein
MEPTAICLNKPVNLLKTCLTFYVTTLLATVKLMW